MMLAKWLHGYCKCVYIHSTFDEETFETSDTRFDQGFQRSLHYYLIQKISDPKEKAYLIVGNDSTPERDICPALATSCVSLDFEVLSSGGRRD